MNEQEYLKMPWSVEDTIENLKEIRDMLIGRALAVNLDGKAESDAKEIEFDFDRAIKALEEIQQYREYKTIFEEHMPKTTIDIISDKKEFAEWLDRMKWNLEKCDELYCELEPYKKLGTVEKLREAMEKQRWIPCSERLPERNKPVLCWVKSTTIASGETYIIPQ